MPCSVVDRQADLPKQIKERKDKQMKFEVERLWYGWIVKSKHKYPKTLYLVKIYKGKPEFSRDYAHARSYTTESKAKQIAAQLSR